MPPISQDVTFPSNGTPVRAYLARPAGDGPFPALVVIHEVFGLNDNIKDIARRFADQGYVALASDLFNHGNRALCMVRLFSGMMLNSLDHQGIRDLKAALTYLAQQPGVDKNRLGAIGFCMGGGMAIAWACTDDRLKAVAPFYGQNPRPVDIVSRSCPVVGSYPGKDFTTKGGQKLDHVLDTYHIPHDIKVYPAAKHSFFNDQSRNHDPAASQDAWLRVLRFFKEHIDP